MEDNLRSLSGHLSQASSIISSLLQEGHGTNIATPSPGENTTTTTPSSGRCIATPSTSDIASVVNRARSMIAHSTSRGSFSRLNRRERLRATTTTTAAAVQTKKKKEDEIKVFEFVLMNVKGAEGNVTWNISDEKVILRGLIEIKTSSKEAEIRQAIGNATRVKYSMVKDSDFEFLRATRRKLYKPVNCQSFDYKQLKLMAGQGAVYVKLKDWLDCLLVDENNIDDDGKSDVQV